LKLPRVSGKQTVNALIRAGCEIHRIRGSHYILKHRETGLRVTIPYHRKELALKTLNTILKQAKLDTDTFINLL